MIKGRNILGFETSSEGTVAFQSVNPSNGDKVGPLFFKATENEINIAVDKAKAAFGIYRNMSGVKKAAFLEAIALEIENLGDNLLERYTTESGLPLGRAQGERGRTIGQLRLFAHLLKEGSWVNATIDFSQPDRQPLPKPDLRSMQRPLGPVVIFGASNFPLAFSVAGGDTVSALAAGCPVVFKAHPSHPGTSEFVGLAIIKAAQETGMPEGVFSLIFDDGIEAGQKLVVHPDIKAVGFTGSFRGGKAIYDTAVRRPEPIPVYAEMGSTNPVFFLSEIVEKNGDNLAKNYLASVTMGVGQFCTNPGVLVYQTNKSFKKAVSEAASVSNGGVMLNSAIESAYNKGVGTFSKQSDVLSSGVKPDAFLSAQPFIFHCNADKYLSDFTLHQEVFGPSSIMVETSGKAQMLKIASELEGHLTASVFGTDQELVENADLLQTLEQKVGRLIINGFPTGVEVTHAMVHGGPFPATTDSRSTSVGTASITRFTRPVCFQDMPQVLLPDELKDSNPLNIWRKIDGEFKR